MGYVILSNGTIKDLKTGLIWEVKCSCGGLHDAANTYRWSGDGTQETIWDWLEDINAEGGTGYAGKKDWRIPNVKELQSIVNYELLAPALDPIFGPANGFGDWSSSTPAFSSPSAWFVHLGLGNVGSDGKSSVTIGVRAVRGGPK